MLKRRNYKNFKSAGITVEVSLAMALGIVVLFLAIGIFSDNLKTMVSASGIQNLFKQNSNSAKTHYDTQSTDYSGSQIAVANKPPSSQENEQIMGDQGLTLNTLQDYLDNSQATIDKYTKNPPTTEAQLEDLAKAATIKKVNDSSSLTQQEKTLLIQNNITINVTNGQTTINNSKTINYSHSAAINTDADVLAAMKVIYNS